MGLFVQSMATKLRLLSSVLGIFLLVSSFPSRSASAQKVASCVTRDRDALLSFKNGLFDSSGQLISWNETRNCCNEFVGVSCNAKGEVVNVTFAGFVPDDGCDEDCPYIDGKDMGKNVNLIGTTLSKLLALQILNLSTINLGDVVPTGLSSLKHLEVLSLKNMGLNGTIPDDIGKITSLKFLSLSSNQIKGPYPASLCQLHNLQTLDFSQTLFEQAQPAGVRNIPPCIGSLQKLENLLLEVIGLTGSVPDSVRNLKALKVLKLTGNKLSGPIPAFLGELSALEKLFLQGNDWTGSIPTSLGDLSNLKDLRLGGIPGLDNGTYVDLIYTKINGFIPASLGMLTKLEVLIIRGTQIVGVIPSSLGNARRLSDLELDHNQLSGLIPAELGRTNLTTLLLNDNKLSGALPASLGNLKFLATFVTSRNVLIGPIPVSFSRLNFGLYPEPGVLDLSHNNLDGSIPKNLGFALSSCTLDLSYNQLTGPLNPESLWGIRTIILNNNLLTSLGDVSLPDDGVTGQQLAVLDVHSNKFTGPIPRWAFQLSFVETLDLSDNAFTKVPSFIGSKLGAIYLNISSNQITGTISDEFTKLSGASTIDLSKNMFSGSIPRNFSSSFSYLNNLILGENQLTGTIPPTIFESTFFNVLVLNKNKLTGPIPSRSGNDFLNYVDLSDNYLSGSIPPSLFNNSALLNVVKLSNNLLTGPIPNLNCGSTFNIRQIILENNLLSGTAFGSSARNNMSQCSSLEVYDVSGNLLTGDIPSAVGEIKSLVVLDVSKNSLSGSVLSIGSLNDKIQVLDLSSNNFSGSVPWKQLSSDLSTLKVAGNSAKYYTRAPLYKVGISFQNLGGDSGPSFLRDAVFSFSASAGFNFSRNSLSGAVDTSIGGLKGLRLLDLASNAFSGSIPASIAGITDLEDLHLENNRFSGKIPQGLHKFPASDFAGNPQLCGPPLSKNCS